jgi:diguanylate cyclase (GGDEF)-like protein/PAS domain S-box-containing protein
MGPREFSVTGAALAASVLSGESELRETLAVTAIDALVAHVAILDPDGVIVEVNETWKRFARANGGATGSIGVNYLSVCERAALDPSCPTAPRALEGIREVIEGKRERFYLEYPCDSPSEKRWFDLHVTRAVTSSGPRIVIAHHDITPRKESELTLEQTEKLLRNVLETLPVGIWIMNAEGLIIQGNAAGQKIWAGARYVGPEAFGEYKGWWVHSGEPIAPDQWAAARAIRNGETSIDEEVEIQCFDGTRKIILNSAIPLRDADGRVTGAIIVNQDVTGRFAAEKELVRAKRQLEEVNLELSEALAREHLLARTDVLTGVKNRRDFFEIASHEFGVAKRYGNEISLILFDIDFFKRVNDSFGHEAGDAVLRRIARLAETGIREADLLARYGGEEFIVLLPNSPPRLAAVMAERIRAAIEQSDFPEAGAIGTVTISAGVAGCIPGEESLDEVIRRADNALYRAKANGRNRVEIFEGSDAD